MSAYQYMIIFCYALLLISSPSRRGAVIILSAFLLYYLLVNPLEWKYYYAATALINTVAGFLLCKKYLAASICSFSLILINAYGYMLCYNYQPPDNYDNISLTILIIQLITMLPKGLFNGIYSSGRNGKHTMVRAPDFDGGKARVIMYENKEQKEARK